MKFLIYNYASPWSTEALYLNAGLNLFEKNICSSSMYNKNMSVYDNFDLNKPDYVITKSNLIDKDFLSYISSNHDIKVLINVDYLDDLTVFNEKMQLLNPNISLFGSRHMNLKNYVQILPSADIFIHPGIPQYDIDKLIFIKNESDICDLEGSYHYTTDDLKLTDKVDFVLSITDLQKIFCNYKEIVFKHIDYIGSQVSFNAIYSGKRVTFETNDKNYTDRMNSIFKGSKQLNAVKKKHTCLHRLKTITNYLGLNDISKNVDTLLEKI